MVLTQKKKRILFLVLFSYCYRCALQNLLRVGKRIVSFSMFCYISFN